MSAEDVSWGISCFIQVDLIVDHQHNRFPYPAIDRKRIQLGWAASGSAVFANACNRQKSSTTPGTKLNPAAEGLPKEELFDAANGKKVGGRVHIRTSDEHGVKKWNMQKVYIIISVLLTACQYYFTLARFCQQVVISHTNPR